jgi:hypothetical protein
MKRNLLALVALAGLPSAVMAQDINIDFGQVQGVPQDTYGAAAGTPGFWNAPNYEVGVPQPLSDLSGTPTSVTVTDQGSFGQFSFANPAVTDPNDFALVCDYLDTGSGVVDFMIAGLEPGKYDFYTYAWAADSEFYIAGVSVNGSSPVSIGGAWPGSLVENIVYAKHTIDVTGNVTITINAVATFGTLNGIQIRKSGPPLLSLQLTNPVPTTIVPGSPVDFDVTINPNTEALVGTPQFCYSLAGGPFNCVNMTNTGGFVWRGTLPAASCSDQPKFYFTATGSQSGLKTLPFNAPTNVYSTIVSTGTQIGAPINEGFNSGLPAGWTATSLWHVTDSCNSTASCDGGTFAYFGDDASCTFLEGVMSTGSLTSPNVAIPAGATARLDFCYRYDGEGGVPFDYAGVVVNGTDVWQASNALDWTPVAIDLTGFAGTTINVEFFFDSVDSLFNNFLGFQVDGVVLTSDEFVCEDSCYPDCDASGTLNIDDFVCFQTYFAIGDPYADCDASGTLNIDDFICFQTYFAIGC